MRKEKIKGQLCVFFTAAALMALTACGSGEQNGQESDSGHSGEESRTGNPGMEEQPASGGASVETDSGGKSADDTGTTAVLSSPELPQPYARYMEVLEQIRTEGQDSNGRVYVREGDFEHNCFAIRDVDNDGKQELIFNFNESYMAGMHEVVYEYDEETDTLREELSDWVSTTYYSNGIVKVECSHNHGKDPYERGVWPYDVYQYDAEEDGYKLIYTVDSWDGMTYEKDFPDKKDVDGDRLLYSVGGPGVSRWDIGNVMILDSEEYNAWAGELMPEWCRISLVYRRMEEDFAEKVRSAYAQAAAYAAQADMWFVGEEAGASSDYLLHDLDGDGSLELITSVMQGTGRFSDNHFYSLTDSGEIRELELVRMCDSEERDWNADFDIGGVFRVRTYQDSEGTVYYEGTDYMREGIYGVVVEDGFYYLKDGVLYHDSIRWREEIFHEEDDREDEIYYYSMEQGPAGEGIEITGEQYEAIREEYVRDMTEGGVYLNWVYFPWDEITQGNISEEDICVKLFESVLGSG